MLPKRPSEEDIKVGAYFKWEKAGKPYGRDWEFFFSAEDEIFYDWHKFSRHPQKQTV